MLVSEVFQRKLNRHGRELPRPASPRACVCSPGAGLPEMPRCFGLGVRVLAESVRAGVLSQLSLFGDNSFSCWFQVHLRSVVRAPCGDAAGAWRACCVWGLTTSLPWPLSATLLTGLPEGSHPGDKDSSRLTVPERGCRTGVRCWGWETQLSSSGGL